MTKIHLLLTPDNEHNKMFRGAPIIGFRRAKSLKDILVRSKIPQIRNKGWCGPCKRTRCETYKHIVPTRSFTSSTTKHTCEIRPENLNYRFKNVVYLFTNNTLQVQRNLGQGLMIIGVRIVAIAKALKLNKTHFTLFLQMIFHSGEGD